MEYSFGRSYNRLDMPDFDALDQESTHKAVSFAHVIKHFHLLIWTVKRLPPSIQKHMGRALATITRLQRVSLPMHVLRTC
jgi:hypothetical protein